MWRGRGGATNRGGVKTGGWNGAAIDKIHYQEQQQRTVENRGGGQMANYEVEFAYSTTATPDVFDTLETMLPVDNIPDDLQGKALLDHIEAHLHRRVRGIAKIKGLRIRG
jgi:hypothetical protein